MGARENRVEAHLDQRVKELGGVTRKWVSPGRDGVPDRIVIVKGYICFVEIKTVAGRLSPVQRREIERLQNVGADVFVAHGHGGVATVIDYIKSKLQELDHEKV